MRRRSFLLATLGAAAAATPVLSACGPSGSQGRGDPGEKPANAEGFDDVTMIPVEFGEYFTSMSVSNFNDTVVAGYFNFTDDTPMIPAYCSVLANEARVLTLDLASGEFSTHLLDQGLRTTAGAEFDVPVLNVAQGEGCSATSMVVDDEYGYAVFHYATGNQGSSRGELRVEAVKIKLSDGSIAARKMLFTYDSSSQKTPDVPSELIIPFDGEHIIAKSSTSKPDDWPYFSRSSDPGKFYRYTAFAKDFEKVSEFVSTGEKYVGDWVFQSVEIDMRDGNFPKVENQLLSLVGGTKKVFESSKQEPICGFGDQVYVAELEKNGSSGASNAKAMNLVDLKTGTSTPLDISIESAGGFEGEITKVSGNYAMFTANGYFLVFEKNDPVTPVLQWDKGAGKKKLYGADIFGGVLYADFLDDNLMLIDAATGEDITAQPASDLGEFDVRHFGIIERSKLRVATKWDKPRSGKKAGGSSSSASPKPSSASPTPSSSASSSMSPGAESSSSASSSAKTPSATSSSSR